jgi:ABC-type glycerol-3-phosphate transport system substrate-binding protein
MNRARAATLLGLLLLALPSLGLQCKQRVAPQPVKLTYWRVFDEPDTMKDIIAAYRARHPHVSIEYRKLRLEEYEQLFLEALAEDRGPDIFSVHNTWLGEYESKIAPLPKTTSVAEQRLEGTIKKEVVHELRQVPALTPTDLKKTYLDVVAADVVRVGPLPEGKGKTGERILGLPLAVDTLVMFYNRDILNSAGVVNVPEDWTEFLDAVTRVTRFDEQGNVAVAGAALGTAANIPRFADILSVLMMQNGAAMTDGQGRATFHLATTPENRTYRPGLEALRFYTDFASPTKQAYTWNAALPDALDAFAAGKVAFVFGYAYHVPVIRARAPQLRWGVAPLPQTDAERNRVNFANYWVETVSAKSQHQNEAWDFLQFAARAEQVGSYLRKTGKPTALRALVEQQLQDPVLEPFAGQLLTAKSWYRGRNAAYAEAAIQELIEGVLSGAEKLDAVVNRTVAKINQTR